MRPVAVAEPGPRPNHRAIVGDIVGRQNVDPRGASDDLTVTHRIVGLDAHRRSQVGDGSGFAKARDLGAWLGLVPRQHTTGGKPRLLGISKRGNTYLRTLLIHGARAALPSLSQSDTPLGLWLKAMIDRGVHRNAVVVALANKLARIAWVALRKGVIFERSYPVAA